MRNILIVMFISLAIGVGVGWLVGQPQENWRTWRDRVLRYQADTVGYLARQDSLEAQRDSALARAAAAEDSARVSRNLANHERRIRLAYQQRADSFARALAGAVTPADSLQACMGELFARRLESAACATETAHLRDVVRLDSVGLRGQAQALEAAERAHSDTKARLRRADSLLKAAPAPGGCALPLCTALTLELEPWDRTFFVGVSIPIRTWIRAGVLRRLTNP